MALLTVCVTSSWSSAPATSRAPAPSPPPRSTSWGRRTPVRLSTAGHTPDDIADILYTSGSTGSPKGVQVTHDAVLRTAYASALTRAYEDGRRILFSLPCYHMFGYVEGLLSATFVGGAVVMLPSFSAEGYLTAIEKHRATDMLCVPTMAVALVESPLRLEADLSSLSAILCGSAPAPVWLWEQVERDFGVNEIVTGYGMTECGGAMTLTLPEDSLELTSTTVGRPKLAGSAGVAGSATYDGWNALCLYRTADPGSGDLLPEGEIGELVSTGPTTMLGYYAKPDETASALRTGGEGTTWLHSGDLGRVRAGRLPGADRPEQGGLQVRRRARDAEGGRGGAGRPPRRQPGVRDRAPR